jgi:microcystin-dependent protein
MKNILVFLLIFSQVAFAGLPPTTSKNSSDTSNITTFNYQFPNFTGTHTGTTFSLGIDSVAGGGTGLATLTAHYLLVGNGTGNVTLVSPGSTAGYILTSNGTSLDPSFQAISSGVNAGDVVQTGATTCPAGTLAEDGSAISRTVFSALFTAIGTTYGVGDGSTTFNVPNAKGVFEKGAGSQTISSISYTGTQGTTQGDQLQGHIHNMTTNNGQAGSLNYYGPPFSNSGATYSTTNFNSTMTPLGPSSDGTNGTPRVGADTHPANISHLHCIRYTASAIPAGSVAGPGSSTSGNIATYNGTSGAILQDSGVAPTAIGGFLPMSTGSLTGVSANEIVGSGKTSRALVIQNIIGSATTFTCTGNPVLSLLDCGTSAGACTSGTTTLGSVTLTAANTITVGSISTSTIASGHFWAWEITSGTCTVLDANATAGL